MAVHVNTQFQDNFDQFDGTYSPSLYTIVNGRGIDFGKACTCSVGFLSKEVASPPNFALTNTARFQVGFHVVSTAFLPVSLINFSSNTVPGDPVDPYTNNFNSSLLVYADGHLSFYVSDLSGQVLLGSSAAGIFALDGSMHGIQVNHTFTSNNSLTYNIVVNNVSVISGSYTTEPEVLGVRYWGYRDPNNPAIYIQDGGLSLVEIRLMRFASPFRRMTSIAEVIIEDGATIIAYPACNAINADAYNGCVAYTSYGTIVVQKVVSPSSDPTIFEITAAGHVTNLAHGESYTVNVSPGVHSVAETADPDFSVSYNVSSGDPNTAIDISIGETVTVIVTNTYLPSPGGNGGSGLYVLDPYSGIGIIPSVPSDQVVTSFSGATPPVLTTAQVAIPTPMIQTGPIEDK